MEKFKVQKIFPEIMDREEQDAVFPLWLMQLDMFPYTYEVTKYDEWKAKKDEEGRLRGRPGHTTNESDNEEFEEDE